MMKKDGLNWKRSEERKERDMERRITEHAEQKKLIAIEEEKEQAKVSQTKRMLQLLISESWKKLPQVKKKAIEEENEQARNS